MSNIMNGVFVLQNYPYFLITCVLMIFFVAGVLVCPKRHRLTMLLSALMSMPFSLASFLFDPEYWHPVRIIDYRIGIEDFIFSFASGGLVWLFAIWPLRRKICFKIKAAVMLKRHIAVAVCSYMMYLVFRHIGFGVMGSVLSACGLLTLIVFFIRHDLWPVWLIGCTVFTPFYLLFVKACLVFFPNLIIQWNANALWGYYPWGIPAEELVWAALFGGGWPLIMFYMFDGMPFRRMRDHSPIEGTR